VHAVAQQAIVQRNGDEQRVAVLGRVLFEVLILIF
jgi:hypothetical protein